MIPLYILGIIGLFVVPRFFAGLALILLGYQTLVAMLFVGETRYRVPWDFLIALLASAALVDIVRRTRERERVAGPAARRPSTASDATSASRRFASSRS